MGEFQSLTFSSNLFIYSLLAAFMYLLKSTRKETKSLRFFKLFFISLIFLTISQDFPQLDLLYLTPIFSVLCIYFLFIAIRFRQNQTPNYLLLNGSAFFAVMFLALHYIYDLHVIYLNIAWAIFFIPVLLTSVKKTWLRPDFNNKGDKLLSVFIISYIFVYLIRVYLSYIMPSQELTWGLWRIAMPIIATGIGLSLILSYMLEAQSHLIEISIKDPLTGLYNRRGFEEVSRHQLPLLARNKASIFLMVLDIDHFKKVNDTYGHAGGDEALCRVAGVLSQQVRKNDIIMRQGGEEFCVLFSDVNEQQGLLLAEKTRQSIEHIIINFQNRSFQLTASFGVISSEAEGIEIHSILDKADAALYKAKRTGRNKVCLANI